MEIMPNVIYAGSLTSLHQTYLNKYCIFFFREEQILRRGVYDKTLFVFFKQRQEYNTCFYKRHLGTGDKDFNFGMFPILPWLYASPLSLIYFSAWTRDASQWRVRWQNDTTEISIYSCWRPTSPNVNDDLIFKFLLKCINGILFFKDKNSPTMRN